MSHSTLFAQSDLLFKLPTSSVQQTLLPVDWSHPSNDSHLGLWFDRQLSHSQDSHPRKMMTNNNFLTHSEFTVGNVGSEYTITTQIAADPRQAQDPYIGGAMWPNMFATQPVPVPHPNWDQLYFPGFSGDLTPNTPAPVLNNGYVQAALVPGPQSAYDGIPTTGAQLSPAPSENALSPLFSTSSRLSSPSTPSSSYNMPFSSPVSSKDLLLTSVENQTPGDTQEANTEKSQYSHREQQVMFREAFKLPMNGAGPFIPQQMYKPHTTSDRKRYVEEVLLEAPLFFYSDSPARCGILLKDALHSRTRKLHNRDQAVFEGRGPSVSIRLEWPGYRQWSKQIPTKDFRNPPGPITLAKLAKNVAKCVQRFIQERKSTAMEEDSDRRWRIGDGPDDIKLEDLVLVSMHHVSLGSWQPQLRLVRPREPRFSRRGVTPAPSTSAPSIPVQQHARIPQ